MLSPKNCASIVYVPLMVWVMVYDNLAIPLTSVVTGVPTNVPPTLNCIVFPLTGLLCLSVKVAS